MDLTLDELRTRITDIVGVQASAEQARLTRWINIWYQQIGGMAEWKELLAIDTATPVSDAGQLDASFLALPYTLVDTVYAVSNRGADLTVLRDGIISGEARFVNLTDQSGTPTGFSVIGTWPIAFQPDLGTDYVFLVSTDGSDTSQSIRIRGYKTLTSTSATHRIPVNESLTLNGTSEIQTTSTVDFIEQVSKDSDSAGTIYIYHGTNYTTAQAKGVAGIIGQLDRQSRYTVLKLNRVDAGGNTYHYLYKRRVTLLTEDWDVPEIVGISKALIHAVSSEALRRRRHTQQADEQFALYQDEMANIIQSRGANETHRMYPEATYREAL